MPRIALLQMTAGIVAEENFQTIRNAVVEARRGGALMLFTPEMSLVLDRDRERARAHSTPDIQAHYLAALRALAAENNLFLALGSIAFAEAGGRFRNRSFLFPPAGGEPVYYDKLHMFDVDLAGGQSWRESNAYDPGDRIVTAAATPVGRLGLTICYDVRFPALFHALGREACDAIAVPAAFTVPTGRAHWHILLRARAIEATAFVIAAAQVGVHEDGRQTFGHSLVVDPWGEVLLDMGGDRPGLAFADIDLRLVEELRRQLPSLANRRDLATEPKQ